MFIGHFAVGLAAKRKAPKASLGTLFLSAQLVDLLWPIFLLLGLEHVRIAPGITAFTPLDFYDYPYTHSLVAALIWSLLFGLIYFAIRGLSREAFILSACVFSHWVLDLISHRPDLPLAPGVDARWGLGLWNSVLGSVLVEGVLFLAGVWIYTRSTRARDRTGRWALGALLLFLLLVWTANIFSPPPPNAKAVAWSALLLWLLIPWGYWIDRHRQLYRLK